MYDNSEIPVVVTALALIGAYVVARKGYRLIRYAGTKIK